MTLSELSEQLLLRVKMEQPTQALRALLQNIPMDRLYEELTDDDQKKAFWINLYNAFYQILRKEEQVEKPAIYRNKLIPVAGKAYSLDDLEHGILRRYRFKFSLGYLPNYFVAPHLKKLAVATMDYRIHFALNCGARSCPPIAFYTPEKLNSQLEMATLSFLEAETEVFPDKKEIHVTRLFQWFAGDFGGRKGMRKILQEKLQLKTDGMRLVFKEYDWEESLGNFGPATKKIRER